MLSYRQPEDFPGCYSIVWLTGKAAAYLRLRAGGLNRISF
jgi:hypothetical protein